MYLAFLDLDKAFNDNVNGRSYMESAGVVWCERKIITSS